MQKRYVLALGLGLSGHAAYSQIGSPPSPQAPALSAPAQPSVSAGFEEGADPTLSYGQVERVAGPAQARTGLGALQLSGRRGHAAGLATGLLPVAAQQQVTATVYATYALSRRPLETLALAAGGAVAAYGQSQAGTGPAGPADQPRARPRGPLFVLGAGLALGAGRGNKRGGAPRAALRYRLYDADTLLVATGQQALPTAAQEGWRAGSR